MSALLLPELRQIVLLLLPVVSTASLCSSGWPLLLLAGGGGGVCGGGEHAFSRMLLRPVLLLLRLTQLPRSSYCGSFLRSYLEVYYI